MEDSLYMILALVAAYLIGSIPTAVWVGNAMYGCDVRKFGSGNAGATNTFRVLGRSAGVIVTLVDIAKGMGAAALANILMDHGIIHQDQLTLMQIVLGLVAIIGHIFPVWAGFRGGKGVATMVGMILTIQLEVALLTMLTFFLVLYFSKYVSLGSIMASLVFPLLLMMPVFGQELDTRTILLSFSLFALVLVTHQQNIRRLLSGSESKSVIRLRKR